MRLSVLILWFILVAGLPAEAQEAVYIIRHAEKELTVEEPPITEAGKARASAWGEMLQNVGLDIVITSDALRTRQTGEIIAARLGVPKNSIHRADITGLIDTLGFDHEEDTVLIVGHAETIPGILQKLGVAEKIEISQTDFANLFVVFRPGVGKVQMVRLTMPH